MSVGGVRIKDYASTTFITGLRAWASLGVLLIHAGGAGLRALGPWGDALVDLGRGGVYAFFVISGFSVAASYAHAGGFGRYLFLRFMRLAPLYYFWLLLYAVVIGRSGVWAQSFGVPRLPLDLFLHLSFLHAFFIPAANSILGVEWSLSVEMFWYWWLPGLIWLSYRGRGLWLPVLALLSYALFHIFLDKRVNDDAIKFFLLWDPLLFFLPFALGVLAHRLRDKVGDDERRQGTALAFVLFGAYWAFVAWKGPYAVDMMPPIALILFLLLIYGSNDDPLCRALFLSKPALWLGTLSYGLYLAHLFVIHFVDQLETSAWTADFPRFAIILGISVILTWATYRWVEQPALRWSKRSFAL